MHLLQFTRIFLLYGEVFRRRSVAAVVHGWITVGLRIQSQRSHLQRPFHNVRTIVVQWLKCNGTQGNAVPHLQFMTQSVPPPQIVIMLGKGTRPSSSSSTNFIATQVLNKTSGPLSVGRT